MTAITEYAILNRAIDFAARIYATAEREDRLAIAAYGGCLLIGARVGSRTEYAFIQALENCWTQEYEDFTVALTENELALLENHVAMLVARLSKYGNSGVK